MMGPTQQRDGGVTWKSPGQNLPFDKGGYLTGLVVLDPAGEELLTAYSGCGDMPAGVYRSKDGGKTWRGKLRCKNPR